MFPFWKSRKQRQAEEAEWLEAERAAEREAAAWVPEVEVIDGGTGRMIRYRHWLLRAAAPLTRSALIPTPSRRSSSRRYRMRG
jgi:hypothetical protein